MSNQEKYLCNADDNPITKEAFNDLKDYSVKAKSDLEDVVVEIEKLESIGEDIMKGKAKVWEVFEEKLKEAYPGVLADDVQVRFNDEGQIFYKGED